MHTLLLLVVPSLHAGVEWGVAPCTQKILTATELPTDTSARVQAARGEWEGFQVMLLGDRDLASLDATLSDLNSEDGAVIESAAARLYREWYLDIEQASAGGVTGHEREPGLYPDPLVPLWDPWSDEDRAVGAALPLAAGEVGALYVDLWVPRDAAWGTYAGTLQVDADGELIEIPVELEVWDLEIPLERTVATAFGVSDSAFRYYHGGSDEEADDQLEEVDWSAYDAYMEPWIEGTMFPDGVGSTRFDISRFRPGGGTGSWTDDEYKQAAAVFAEHLDEKGWWDKAYVYASDEPWLYDEDVSYEQIHTDAQRLFEASSLFEGKVLVTGPYDERIDGDIGIWCPVTPMYDTWFWGQSTCAGMEQACPGREVYQERLAMGEELWFYVCNANFPPYAGYDIDTAIGYEPRMVKWGAWYEGATGFLFWRSTYWVENDPWNVWANYDQFGVLAARNGDGFIFYPGDHDGTAGTGSPEQIAIDGPVVSYRMKQIRDGLEDWELFILADQLGGGEYAREQVARAYARFGDSMFESCDDDALDHYHCPDDPPWTTDQDLLLEVRANVAAKVLYLQDPDSWPDPEAEPEDTGSDGEPGGCGGCASGGGLGAGDLLGLFLAALVVPLGRTRSRRGSNAT